MVENQQQDKFYIDLPQFYAVWREYKKVITEIKEGEVIIMPRLNENEVKCECFVCGHSTKAEPGEPCPTCGSRLAKAENTSK